MGDDDTKAAAASNKKEYGGGRGKHAFGAHGFGIFVMLPSLQNNRNRALYECVVKD